MNASIIAKYLGVLLCYDGTHRRQDKIYSKLCGFICNICIQYPLSSYAYKCNRCLKYLCIRHYIQHQKYNQTCTISQIYINNDTVKPMGDTSYCVMLSHTSYNFIMAHHRLLKISPSLLCPILHKIICLSLSDYQITTHNYDIVKNAIKNLYQLSSLSIRDITFNINATQFTDMISITKRLSTISIHRSCNQTQIAEIMTKAAKCTSISNFMIKL